MLALILYNVPFPSPFRISCVSFFLLTRSFSVMLSFCMQCTLSHLISSRLRNEALLPNAGFTISSSSPDSSSSLYVWSYTRYSHPPSSPFVLCFANLLRFKSAPIRYVGTGKNNKKE
ncbi:uncharacterized protein GGS22DRAFT_145537 [Annulohypoxylon maeteangense]|uniref:uncharacterized protein n=1 Tax=Annulohypoxylon maeteangense TaxID=1927788 RepID=UPI002008757B|nr:uncharacterized protein GGS22DRAFT_145537 [Annulohypoxylon maeteangense]KAI0884668.1 hypothetical protein GGS22DRAFT_145537 [Annulohypoxylon maeteangense]